MIAAALITAVLIAVMILRARPAPQTGQVRILAEHVVDKVSTHDADGTFRYVSAVFAGLLGEYPGMLVGKHPREFAHPDDVQVLAPSVLTHRLLLAPDAAGGDRVDIVRDALERVPAL